MPSSKNVHFKDLHIAHMDDPHGGCGAHNGPLTQGSPHVFIQNRPLVRQKDLPPCGGRPDHQPAPHCHVGAGGGSAITTIKKGRVQSAPRRLCTAVGHTAGRPAAPALPHIPLPRAVFLCHPPPVPTPFSHPVSQAPRPPVPPSNPADRSLWQNVGPSALHVGANFLRLPSVAGTFLKSTALGAGNMAEKYGDAAMYGVHTVLGNKQAAAGYYRAADRAGTREKTAAQPLMDILGAVTPGTLRDLTVAAADKAGGQPEASGKVLHSILPNAAQAFHDDPAQTALNAAALLGGAGGALGKAGDLVDAAGAARLGSGLSQAGEAARYVAGGGPVGRGAGAAGVKAAEAGFQRMSPAARATLLRAREAIRKARERGAIGGQGGSAGQNSSLAIGKPYVASGLAGSKKFGNGAAGLDILNAKQLALYHRVVKSSPKGGAILKPGEISFGDVAALTRATRLEHALVRLKDGSRVLIRGDQFSITHINRMPVKRLIVHSHPGDTPGTLLPSGKKGDLDYIWSIGQRRSYIVTSETAAPGVPYWIGTFDNQGYWRALNTPPFMPVGGLIPYVRGL